MNALGNVYSTGAIGANLKPVLATLHYKNRQYDDLNWWSSIAICVIMFSSASLILHLSVNISSDNETSKLLKQPNR